MTAVMFRYEASLREVKEAERRRAEELMADLRQRYLFALSR